MSTVELRARDLDHRRRVAAACRRASLISSENVAENSRFCRRLRQQREHALDVADEAHVEHAVGFVEHEDLDVREVDGALAVMVEQAARRRDEDVDAALQLRDLRADADAAEHRPSTSASEYLP